MADPFDLTRFLTAQADTYERALSELQAGRKQTHWMWFIFPQIAGLGQSATARHYAITSREEAFAFLAHPLLGSRLVECTAAMLRHAGRPPEAVLGGVDALKFHSSMTLFDAIGGASQPSFAKALVAFYNGQPDRRTLALLA
jgi:uncharacterized protein (DUF1810 family)